MPAACGESEDVVHLDDATVTYPSASTICDGTLDFVTSEMDRISTQLRVQQRQPIRITLTADAAEATARCGLDLDVGGCARVVDGRIDVVSGFGSLAHELVHAYRRHDEESRTNPFFEEGIAERFSHGYFPYRAVRAEASSVVEVAQELRDFQPATDTLVAGHYVTWLVEHFGEETVVDFYLDAGSGGISSRFERHFGMTIADSESLWITETELVISLGSFCPVPDIVYDGAAVEIEVEPSCDKDGFGPAVLDDVEESSATFCFRSSVEGEIETTVLSDSGPARVQLTNLECPEGGPYGVELTNDRTVAFEDGPTVSPFAPCVWVGLVIVPTSVDGTVAVRFAPP